MVTDLFTNIPGLAGLIISAVISASLSTLSSGYNGLAAITSEELFRHRFTDWGQSKRTLAAKVTVAVYGILSTIIALTVLYVPGSFAQMTVSLLGALASPVSGMFLVCLLYKQARPNSVVAGGIAGILVSSWLSIGFNFSPTLPPTPWLQPGPTDRCELTNTTGYVFQDENHTRTTANPYNNILADESELDDTVHVGLEIFTDYIPYNTTVTGAYNNITSKWSRFRYENTTASLNSLLYYNETVVEKKEDRNAGPKELDNFYSMSYLYFAVVPILVTAATVLVIDGCLFRQRRRTNGRNVCESATLRLCELD